MAATEEFRREWFEKDYYAILGVPKNAGQAEIKKAYRKLAQQHHPDANAGNAQAEERFKEISGAYDVLGDEEKRTAYDRAREMGAAGFGGGFPGGAGGPGGVSRGSAVRDRRRRSRGSARRHVRRARRTATRAAASRRRPRDRGDVVVRRRDGRRHGAGQADRTGALHHLPRQRRGARHAAHHLPDVWRVGAGGGQPGLLLDGADLPGVPGNGAARSRRRARPAAAPAPPVAPARSR